MKYIIYSLTLVLIYFLVFFVLNKISAVKINNNNVGFVKFILYIGAIGFCVLMSFAGFAFLANSKKVALFFALFSLLGIYFILKFFCFGIEYDDNGFYYKDIFKKRTYIEYKEVKKGYNLEGSATLYTDKGKVKISNMAFNREKFIQRVKEKYKLLYSKELPVKKKFDIFGGHVVNPGEFIFFYVIFEILSLFISFYLVKFLIICFKDGTFPGITVIFLSICLIISILFPILSIVVAHQWQKLPKWFVNLFFQDGYLK